MSESPEQLFDIVIVGAGMVGASLAHALLNKGFSVAIVEAVSASAKFQPSYDDRHLALSLSSQSILNDLGLWSGLQSSATPVKQIHVSDQHHPGMVRLSAVDIGAEAFAYIVVAKQLGLALRESLEDCVKTMFCPAQVTAIEQTEESCLTRIDCDGSLKQLRSRLLILADGTRSSTRAMCGFTTQEKSYRQTAIVCNLRTQLAHNNTAFERFTPQGPFALLPSGVDRMAAVFTVNTDMAEQTLAMTDTEFLSACQQQFGRRLGRFSDPGQRSAYEINLLQVDMPYRGRALLLGNSAHSIHPNGAQGFNLALRDVAVLANRLGEVAAEKGDPGAAKVLQAYHRQRQGDQKRVIKMTDGLAQLFYTSDPFLGVARNLGLMTMQLLPGLKKKLIQQGAGLNSDHHINMQ